MNTNGMKQIGKGEFSTVYRKNKNTVLIKSRDHAKECMAAGWFPECSLFPTLERVGSSDCGEFSFYEEKYYPKKASLKKNLRPSEWEFYKILRGFFNDYPLMGKTRHQYLNTWHECFDRIPGKFHVKREQMKEALDAMGNYGEDVCFEISPRNVTAHNGRLVLLDCFFMLSQQKR